MQVSVILSTFNQPAWLERVLWGYAKQTYTQFEVIIADDGSGPETLRVVKNAQQSSRLKISHVWHPNLGFRKCTVLNLAISEASGDYIIFSDGDCIPRADFVETHVRQASQGVFLSGGTLRLSSLTSQRVNQAVIDDGSLFRPTWQLRNGGNSVRTLSRLLLSKTAASICDRLTSTRPTFNGHNTSCWRENLIDANGFDERMEYGGLDRELGERLENNGICGRQIRHQAICVHLYHQRPYVHHEGLKRNQQIRAQTHDEKSVRTPFGITKDVMEADQVVAMRTHASATPAHTHHVNQRQAA